MSFHLIAAPAVNTFGEGGNFLFDPPRSELAIKGYDSVAYFKENKAVKGKPEFSFEWQKARWQFSSLENLNQFKSEPEKWAPQYGGYCAFGVAKGGLVKIEPDQFTLFEGKLYLNYDANITKDWSKDIPSYIKQADEKFLKLLKN